MIQQLLAAQAETNVSLQSLREEVRELKAAQPQPSAPGSSLLQEVDFPLTTLDDMAQLEARLEDKAMYTALVSFFACLQSQINIDSWFWASLLLV